MQQPAAILYPRIKPWEIGNAESPTLDLGISRALSLTSPCACCTKLSRHGLKSGLPVRPVLPVPRIEHPSSGDAGPAQPHMDST